MTIANLPLVQSEWIRQNGKMRFYLYLSETEKVCYLRGFYRLQIFANIFGPIEFPVQEFNAEQGDNWADKTFTMEEAWRVLFGTMAPWEVAELGCVFQYVHGRYTEPYNELQRTFRSMVEPLWTHLQRMPRFLQAAYNGTLLILCLERMRTNSHWLPWVRLLSTISFIRKTFWIAET